MVKLVRLSALLTPERVGLLEEGSKESVLRQMAELLCPTVEGLDQEELVRVLLAREGIMSTGIGLGIAVPHARMESVDEPAIAVGVARKGIQFESLDDKPVYIVVLIVVPKSSQKEYLRILARVTLLMKNKELRKKLMAVRQPAEIYGILGEY